MEQVRYYSAFWLAGGVLTSSLWAERDTEDERPVHPAEALPMAEWLALGEEARAAVVEGYAYRRPVLALTAEDRRRQRKRQAA